MVEMIRNGQKVWPTCSSCKCRLKIIDDGNNYFLWHFGLFDKDARGHKCSEIAEYWVIAKEDYRGVGLNV